MIECCRLASRSLGSLQHLGDTLSPLQNILFIDHTLQTAALHSWSERKVIHMTSLIPATSRWLTSPPPRAFSSAAEPALRTQQPLHDCWSCGASLTAETADTSSNYSHIYFCPSCGKIQPLSYDSDYFALFNYPAPTFIISSEDLESRYKSLQVKLHPDRFATMSPQEQEHSADQAAAVNQAYDVLRQPLRRAQYILTLAGLGACESLTVTDPELLEAAMEAREEVDAAETQEELKKILEKVNAQEQERVKELAEAFAKGDLESAGKGTVFLRYLMRIKEAIIEKM
jgi:molecular chaperone HscB